MPTDDIDLDSSAALEAMMIIPYDKIDEAFEWLLEEAADKIKALGGSMEFASSLPYREWEKRLDDEDAPAPAGIESEDNIPHGDNSLPDR